MSQIPIGWLMQKEGVGETPLTTGLFDDRWYTKSAPLFLPKGHYWFCWFVETPKLMFLVLLMRVVYVKKTNKSTISIPFVDLLTSTADIFSLIFSHWWIHHEESTNGRVFTNFGDPRLASHSKSKIPTVCHW